MSDPTGPRPVPQEPGLPSGGQPGPPHPVAPSPTHPVTPSPTDPAVSCLTVLTTTDSAAKAETLAAGAVTARLAACAQISAPVTSVYRWDGAVETGREWQILFKTTADAYDALEAHLRGAHDYDTPEIIATPVVRGSADYLAWVAAETGTS